jgi:hypothetical protein
MVGSKTSKLHFENPLPLQELPPHTTYSQQTMHELLMDCSLIMLHASSASGLGYEFFEAFGIGPPLSPEIQQWK